MSQPVTFYVREAGGAINSGPLATRAAVRASGWLWVRYNGRRYVLNGGIRTPFWINANRPITRKDIP